jgi:hypothetical protein
MPAIVADRDGPPLIILVAAFQRLRYDAAATPLTT